MPSKYKLLNFLMVAIILSMQEIFNRKMDFWFGRGAKIAIAVSGGADSMALAFLARQWGGCEIVALIVDHRLREESGREAALVARRLKSMGLKAEVLVHKGKIPKSNIEAAAREYRYGLLCDWVRERGFDALFVGHQMDEQAETFFLNLMRGSGVYGLAAMEEDSMRDGVRIVRPLLDFRKEGLKDLLRSGGIEWVEDPSNIDDKFTRVKVRKAMAALNLPVERIALAAANLRRAAEAIEFYVAAALCGELSVEALRALPLEVAYRVLAERLGGEYAPRLASIERLYARLLTPGFRGATLGGYKVSVKKGVVVFTREKRKKTS